MDGLLLSQVCNVQQPSCEIAGADEGKIFLRHADFTANGFILDDIMNGHRTGLVPVTLLMPLVAPVLVRLKSLLIV